MNNKSQQQEAAWEAQLVKLDAYRAAHGDCNVRRDWAADPKLGRCAAGRGRVPLQTGSNACHSAPVRIIGHLLIIICSDH